MWSIWGFGELIKKIIQKEDKIPNTGRSFEISTLFFIDKNIGNKDKIDEYWIKLPNSCDFKANPRIIKISPPLISIFFNDKKLVLNVPLFNISIEVTTCEANASAWVIGEIESKKKLKKKRAVKIRSNLSNFLQDIIKKLKLNFLIKKSINIIPKIKIINEIKINNSLFNNPKDKNGKILKIII